jgi:hypothetical protein
LDITLVGGTSRSPEPTASGPVSTDEPLRG